MAKNISHHKEWSFRHLKGPVMLQLEEKKEGLKSGVKVEELRNDILGKINRLISLEDKILQVNSLPKERLLWKHLTILQDQLSQPYIDQKITVNFRKVIQAFGSFYNDDEAFGRTAPVYQHLNDTKDSKISGSLDQLQGLLSTLEEDALIYSRENKKKLEYSNLSALLRSFNNLFVYKNIENRLLTHVSIEHLLAYLVRDLTPEQQAKHKSEIDQLFNEWYEVYRQECGYTNFVPHYLDDLLRQEVDLAITNQKSEMMQVIREQEKKADDLCRNIITEKHRSTNLWIQHFAQLKEQSSSQKVEMMKEVLKNSYEIDPSKMTELDSCQRIIQENEMALQLAPIKQLLPCWYRVIEKMKHSLSVAEHFLEGPIIPTAGQQSGLGEPIHNSIRRILHSNHSVIINIEHLRRLAAGSKDSPLTFLVQNQILALFRIAEEYSKLYTHDQDLETTSAARIDEFRHELLVAFNIHDEQAKKDHWEESLKTKIAEQFGETPLRIAIRGKTLGSVLSKIVRKRVSSEDIKDKIGLAIDFPYSILAKITKNGTIDEEEKRKLINRCLKLLSIIIGKTGLQESYNTKDNLEITLGQGFVNENSMGNYHAIHKIVTYRGISMEIQIKFVKGDDHDLYVGNRSNQIRENFNLNYRYADFLFDLAKVFTDQSLPIAEQDRQDIGYLLVQKLSRASTLSQTIEEILTLYLGMPENRQEDRIRLYRLLEFLYAETGLLDKAHLKEDLAYYATMLRQATEDSDESNQLNEKEREQGQQKERSGFFWNRNKQYQEIKKKLDATSVFPALLYIKFTREYLEHYQQELKNKLNNRSSDLTDHERAILVMREKNTRQRQRNAESSLEGVFCFAQEYREKQIANLHYLLGENNNDSHLARGLAYGLSKQSEKEQALAEEIKKIKHGSLPKSTLTLDTLAEWQQYYDSVPSNQRAAVKTKKIAGLFKFLGRLKHYLKAVTSGRAYTLNTFQKKENGYIISLARNVAPNTPLNLPNDLVNCLDSLRRYANQEPLFLTEARRLKLYTCPFSSSSPTSTTVPTLSKNSTDKK